MNNNTILLYEDISMTIDLEKKRARGRRYYYKHRDEILAKKKEYDKIKYPERKEKYQEWNKQWREANPERERERKRKWQKNNKDKKKISDARYFQRHKEERREKNTVHVKEWRDTLTPQKRRSIVEKFRGYQKKFYYNGKEALFHILGHVCVKCGEFDKRCLQVDHINGGGTQEAKKLGRRGLIRYYVHHPDEAKQKLQVLCANCNIIKVYENYENNYRNKSKLQELIKKEVGDEG